jgi:hypothetical protein
LSYNTVGDFRSAIARYNEFARVSVSAKERLAKLLASEDIRVVHSNEYNTAAFDVRNRVLTLPIWKDMDGDLYDLFVGHETGHALYTPDGDHFDSMTAGQRAYLNVVEDARIENGQKRKFPGLRRPMRDGYSSLVDRKFFGELDDIAGLSLIDRINLKAKLGTALDVPFTDDELVTFERVMALRCSDDPARNAELFEEAKALALELWHDERERQSETDTHSDGGAGEPGDSDESDDSAGESSESNSTDGAGDENGESDSSSNDGAESDSSASAADGESDSSSNDGGESDSSAPATDGEADDESDASSSDSSDDEGEDEGDASSKAGDNGEFSDEPSDASGSTASNSREDDGADPGAVTYDTFRENEASLAEGKPEFDYGEPSFVNMTIPASGDIPTADFVIPTSAHVEAALAHWSNEVRDVADIAKASRKILDETTKKGVSLLLKEFEMKKAADASKRAMTSSTGVIDTNKLHTYKWNENIFAKNTIIPDGKSHGLVMFIDFSGSMMNNLPGTIEQLWALLAFCDRASVPYDVYSFTSGAWNRFGVPDAVREIVERGYAHNFDSADQRLGLSNRMPHLLQLASSRDNRTLRSASRDMLALIWKAFLDRYVDPTSSRLNYGLPKWLSLGGTPLNETIVLASNLIRTFQNETRVQIVNAVFLTDGAGHRTARGAGRYATIVARDEETRREYLVDGAARGAGETVVLNQMLRDRTGANVVNFFVSDVKRANQFVTMLVQQDADAAAVFADLNSRLREKASEIIKRPAFAAKWDAWRKDGGVVIENSALGYDQQYLIHAESHAGDDNGIEVDAGASKAKIQRAFLNSRKNALKARRVLQEFTSLIAA